MVSATTTSSQIYYVTIEPLEDLENERVEESVTTAIIPIQTASISPALTNTADTVSATLVRTSTMPSNYTSSTLTNSPLPTSTATSAGNMQVIIQYSIIGGGSLAALLLTALTIYVYRRRRHTKRMRSRAQSQFNSTANMLNMESIEMTKIAAKGDGTLYGLDATCMTSMNTEIARSIATLVTPQRELTVPAFLQRETKDFTTLKQIAKGGGGTVFMAKTSHPEILSKEPSGRIIVKVFERPENPSPAIQKDFIQSFDQEVAIMWFFNGQRNFAELFGYCVDPWIIIMRYYEFGSLQGLIHEQSKHENLESVRFTHRLARQLATDIAMGLNEMHINGFAHADVKSANILLDLDKHQNHLFAVLTDFGIANVVGEKPLLVRGFRVNDNNGGSFAYAGPEVLDRLLANPPRNVNEFPRAQQLSTAADTYAFAIIIYELLTRLYPWKELGSLNDLHKCVKEGERPSLTSEIRRLLDTNDDVTTLYRVMVKCWHGDPFARPKMTAVLNQLRNK